MLQITVHETDKTLTIKLAGQLAAPWLRKVEAFFQAAFREPRKPSVQFDLSEVTMIDDQGKDFLALMHMEGADLLAAGRSLRSLGKPGPPRRPHGASAPFSCN